jgi:hypothetical protein
MWRYGLFGAVVLMAAACSPAEETTGSVNECIALNFPSYNPKAMDQCVAACKNQCVAACKKCQNGVTTTCTTSCTLKGAH